MEEGEKGENPDEKNQLSLNKKESATEARFRLLIIWKTEPVRLDTMTRSTADMVKNKEAFRYCHVCIFLDAEMLKILTTGYKL